MAPRISTAAALASKNEANISKPIAPVSDSTMNRKRKSDDATADESAGPVKKGRVTKQAEAKAADAPSDNKAKPARTSAAAKKPSPELKATDKTESALTRKKITPKAPSKAATASKTKDESTATKPAKTPVSKPAASKSKPKNEPKAKVAKGKRASEERDVESSEPAAKRPRKATEVKKQPAATTAVKLPKVAKPRPVKPRAIINNAPTEIMDLYVFGANSGAELGLGKGSTSDDVKRPRFNPSLAAASAGIVQVACGGMHSIALTKNNKILTWGVNDLYALGRDTEWEGGLVDMNDKKDEDSADDSTGGELNPLESTPTAIDSSAFSEGTVFTCVAAGDSTSWAVTDDGRLYGWGTFSGNDGSTAFSPSVAKQKTPALISDVKKIVKVVTGTNHVLVLSVDGVVYAWGSGEQNQLGRRLLQRNKTNGLIPTKVKLPKGIVDIGSGSEHSFAIKDDGTVYAWGLNNFGQTGIEDGIGEDGASILPPKAVKSFQAHGSIKHITGGNHHSIAISDRGVCMTMGRWESRALGLDVDKVPDDALIRGDKGEPQVVWKPTALPGLSAVYASAGTDHNIITTKDGKAYGFGLSSSFQTGQGEEDDILMPGLIENTAIRGKHMLWAGAGGQFSILGGRPQA